MLWMIKFEFLSFGKIAHEQNLSRLCFTITRECKQIKRKKRLTQSFYDISFF